MLQLWIIGCLHTYWFHSTLHQPPIFFFKYKFFILIAHRLTLFIKFSFHYNQIVHQLLRFLILIHSYFRFNFVWKWFQKSINLIFILFIHFLFYVNVFFLDVLFYFLNGFGSYITKSFLFKLIQYFLQSRFMKLLQLIVIDTLILFLVSANLTIHDFLIILDCILNVSEVFVLAERSPSAIDWRNRSFVDGVAVAATQLSKHLTG